MNTETQSAETTRVAVVGGRSEGEVMRHLIAGRRMLIYALDASIGDDVMAVLEGLEVPAVRIGADSAIDCVEDDDGTHLIRGVITVIDEEVYDRIAVEGQASTSWTQDALIRLITHPDDDGGYAIVGGREGRPCIGSIFGQIVGGLSAGKEPDTHSPGGGSMGKYLDYEVLKRSATREIAAVIRRPALAGVVLSVLAKPSRSDPHGHQDANDAWNMRQGRSRGNMNGRRGRGR